MNYFRCLSIFVLGITLIFASSGMAKDKKGCQDHPLISRYGESEIVRCKKDTFDEYRLITGKVGSDKKGPGKKVEGKVTRITYKTPSDRTTLEVIGNYEGALKTVDFKILYACANNECGGRNFNHTVVPYSMEFAENYKDQRYLAAELKRDEGDVYVSLYTVRNTSSGGSTRNLLYTQLDVVEARPMETGMVTIDASAMGEEISKTGRVALYGIYFDSGKAEVKRESKPTLDEIAKLLQSKKSLELVIVGHTDNQGSFDYNMNLSKQRAKAIVDVLVKDHGILSSRLQHWGVGYLSPVASNKTDAGRAKNRRVELVER